jgi:hypothetical protein
MSFGMQDLLEIRNDPKHRNWHAVGDALMLLGDGLRQYAENKMKELHALITANVGGPKVKCSCRCTLGMKLNPHRGSTTCIWAQELKKLHVFKTKADIPWNQSDNSKWHDPAVGYWEVAKLFMSDLGSDPTKVTDPNSTDVGPLLNLFRFCKHFNVQAPLLKAVTERRNQWAHAPKRRLSDGDKNAAFQDIKLLMNDPELLISKEVQDCKPTINKVEAADVLILEDNQLRLMKEYRRIKECENLQMKERLDAANEEIKILRDRELGDQSLDGLSNKKGVGLWVHNIGINIRTVFIFVMSLRRHVPGWLQWSCTLFFIFSQVGDRSGIASDDGKMTNILAVGVGNRMVSSAIWIKHARVSF